MIIKILKYLIIIFFLQNLNSFAKSNVSIAIKVNNEIITNYDIKKEEQYLRILNPNISELSKKKIYVIGKNSLINEIIKRNEIEKFYDLRKENALVNKVFIDLYTRLNFANENEFKNSLSRNYNYTIKEIKEKLTIEIFWSELIFMKYKELVKIDKKAIINKIKNQKNTFKNEYLLLEIFFNKNKDQNLQEQIKKINDSIKEIGFNNTANIFSISESANFGGKIGWVKEDNLSQTIYKQLNKINVGEFTNVIKVGNGFLILKIEDKKSNKILVDEKKQLDEIISFETNRQLNQFSNIYFNKIKINYSINEK
ncbi:peptidylprolyl isomerase [Candidatus Pelagibacter sp.]|nr:peptidylprolyl isomerase [Candidatus Pelagibacter sp.]MDA9631183.1 peptidylprolyl isomerase [Candidatus Pelagibacter sp.]